MCLIKLCDSAWIACKNQRNPRCVFLHRFRSSRCNELTSCERLFLTIDSNLPFMLQPLFSDTLEASKLIDGIDVLRQRKQVTLSFVLAKDFGAYFIDQDNYRLSLVHMHLPSMRFEWCVRSLFLQLSPFSWIKSVCVSLWDYFELRHDQFLHWSPHSAEHGHSNST